MGFVLRPSDCVVEGPARAICLAENRARTALALVRRVFSVERKGAQNQDNGPQSPAEKNSASVSPAGVWSPLALPSHSSRGRLPQQERRQEMEMDPFPFK